MKRFLLFAGASYYPQGGMHDFRDAFDSAEEAMNALQKEYLYDPKGNPEYDSSFNVNWAHVVNVEQLKIVDTWNDDCNWRMEQAS